LTSNGKFCKIILKGGVKIKKKTVSVQGWMPYQEVLENGAIKLKDGSLVKILIVSPINFNLKSKLEKEAILNSYKIFLKTCNFDLQILIHSNKEDLSKHISKIETISKAKEGKIFKLSQQYINFIQTINKERKSSSKEFYILIKEIHENKKQSMNANEAKITYEKLNDNYFKIKECLARCGNIVVDSNTKEKTNKILYSFFNARKELVDII